MSRHSTLILGATMLTLVAFAAPVAASDTDETVSSTDMDPLGPEPMATPIEPDPTVVEPRPHTWDRVVVSSDGLTLDVYFWMGIEDCNGLHGIDVSPTHSGIDIALTTGQPATMASDTACIEIAQLYVTTIMLEEPLITQPVG